MFTKQKMSEKIYQLFFFLKEQPEPVKEPEPVTHLPPKTPRSKSLPNVKYKGKQKDKIEESAIQNLICEGEFDSSNYCSFWRTGQTLKTLDVEDTKAST